MEQLQVFQFYQVRYVSLSQKITQDLDAALLWQGQVTLLNGNKKKQGRK